MFSDYKLYGLGFLPLLVLNEGVIKSLLYKSQDCQRAAVPRVDRKRLHRVWEANRRHMRAISQLKALTNYGVRKEMTFRLDAIISMQSWGLFDPVRRPHMGLLSRVIPLNPQTDVHYSFWIVYTKDLNAFIFTQAVRIILPLDHLFRETGPAEADANANANANDDDDDGDSYDKNADDNAESPSAQQVLAFYTAQLFCWLLIDTCNSKMV